MDHFSIDSNHKPIGDIDVSYHRCLSDKLTAPLTCDEDGQILSERNESSEDTVDYNKDNEPELIFKFFTARALGIEEGNDEQ